MPFAKNLLIAALPLLLACDVPREPKQAAASATTAGGKATISAFSAAAVEDGQWLHPQRDYANTRFSGLRQINLSNIDQLKVVTTFSTGLINGHEAPPLVDGDTMYLITPFPNIVYALNLRDPGGETRRVYRTNPDPSAQGVACCDVVNRGLAYADGKIVLNTLDNHTIALDAATGSELWNTKLGDINRGETMTMAPLIVRDKVFVGNSGGEYGVRGWLAALDVNTGALVWRAYSTGPDRDVLIGDRFKPFYPLDRGVDLGVKSWPPDRWQSGGGAPWGWVSYDPELDLLYYGTGNPGP